MDVFELGIVLTVVIVCVVIATRPDSSRRRSRSAHGRSRGRRSDAAGRQAHLIDARGFAVQRNRWDRADLGRAIGRDSDELDGKLSVWPGV